MTPDSVKHHGLIHAQYSEHAGAPFYRHVMGGGSPVIHYGIYDSPSTSMQEATEEATHRLLTLAIRTLGSSSLHNIIDLGAGPGGSAHLLARETGAVVTCVDLCPHHNQENETIAEKLGLHKKILTHTGSFEALPDHWTGRFNLAWSQEAICHACDKLTAFREARRVLQNDGAWVFSDIFLADTASPEQSEVFSDINAVARLSTLDQHMERLVKAGFGEITFHDWTPFLNENFRRMLHQIKTHRTSLLEQGVPAELLTRFTESLNQRLAWSPGSVLRWGAFTCKPTNIN